MNKQTYNWKRFWCPREGSISLDNNGFLIQSEFLKNTFGFETITEKRCLILLGEPGIGKSQALSDAVDYVSKNSTDEHFYLDLRSYGSEQRLYDALFNSAEIKQWLDGDYLLQLFLDSLDECLLRVDTVAALLVDELKKKDFPANRLILRISCRTAELPRVLETGLREIYKAEDAENSFGVYELCPLRPEDVLEAARIEKIDAEAFFKQIVQKNVGTLAARPITFGLLLNLFRKHNQFPDKLTDIYEQGCRLLCAETNDNRRDSPRLKSELTADQTMLVAARIAAYMILCNKAAVWRDAETGEHNADDVLIRELHGGNEELAGISFPVTEEAVRKALTTGLFTARGANRQGWTHQTFAEYLAAWYLNHRYLELSQFRELLTNAADAEGKPAPQLAETTAWLASMREDIRQHLLQTDSLMLLRSDVASFSAELRIFLVEEILKLFAEEKERDDMEFRNNYSRLNHPKLAEQLRPYIIDKTQGFLVRRAAIDIAEACELRELQTDLVEIVLNEDEDIYARKNAGYAIWNIGDSQTRKRLRNLALNGSPKDQDAELRGVSLLSTWEEHISADELFDSLVYSPHLLGAYKMFLNRIVPKLKIKDLPIALKWVKEKESDFSGDYAVKGVMDEIMLLAWQNLDAPDVLKSFAETAFNRINRLDDIIQDRVLISRESDDLFEDAGKRRKVLRAIVPLMQGEGKELYPILHSRVLQPRIEDLSWLFEELSESYDEAQQWILAQFIGQFFNIWEHPPRQLNFIHLPPVTPEILSLFYDAYQRSENVRKFFSPIFTLVEFGSPEAQTMKAAYDYRINQDKELKEKRQSRQRSLLEPPRKKQVIEWLEKFDNGDLNAWWNLNLLILSDEYGYLGRNEFNFNILNSDGWAEADSQTKGRIADAAKEYVLKGEPENSKWLGTNTVSRPAFAGYRALILLLDQSPDFIKNLHSEIWRKWAAIIISFPLDYSDEEKIAPHKFLISEAYENAPDEIIKTVLAQIEAANGKENDFFFSKKLEVCWDEKFKTALREKLSNDTLKSSLWGTILTELFQHDDSEVQAIAQSILISFLGGEPIDEYRPLMSAINLFRYAKSSGWWELVWANIDKDIAFGRKLVEAISHDNSLSSRLAENEAADFYIWLEGQYPFKEDPPIPVGGGFVGTRDQISHFRHSFLESLKQRGTRQSIVEIERIIVALPEIDWLKWHLIEAKKNVRRHSWTPLTPTKLSEVLATRVVKTENTQSAISMTVKPLTDEAIDNLEFNRKLVKNVANLANFLKTYRNNPNNIVFFLGAGLSVPLFPSWKTALEEMIKERFLRRGGEERNTELAAMLVKGQLLEVADLCAGDLGRNAYRDFVEKYFDKEFTATDVPEAYKALLGSNPRTVLTTNYDRIPEVYSGGKYRIYTNQESSTAQSAVMNEKPIVFKLHGNVTQPDSIVFSSEEYQTIYQNPSLKNFIEAVFSLKNVIFVGFGLADPYVNQILENLYAGNNRILQGKYALLEGLSLTEINGKEQRYGLNIIPYTKSDDSHPEVLDFVRLFTKVRG
jgi:hypothetical protein